MQTWGLTDPGNIRQQNQDSYAIMPFGRDRVLMIICDGMGGAKSGNVASSLAVEVFTDEVRRTQRAGMTPEKAAAMLRSALELANRAVYEQSQLSDDFTGMGTTLVAAYAVKDNITIINVGDSRAYHITPEGIRQISRDHSVVEIMVEKGDITPQEARRHPNRNLITRALGPDIQAQADTFAVAWHPGDFILLCTDGLVNTVSDQEMLFEVLHDGDIESCLDHLMQISLRRGAPDNVTVVLLMNT